MVSEEIKDRIKKKGDYRMQKQGCHQGKQNRNLSQKRQQSYGCKIQFHFVCISL